MGGAEFKRMGKNVDSVESMLKTWGVMGKAGTSCEVWKTVRFLLLLESTVHVDKPWEPTPEGIPALVMEFELYSLRQ